MDSGTSGSVQSSSGGDEEYDSRADQSSSFLMGTLSTSSSSNPNAPQPPITATASFFDDPPSSSNYLNIIYNNNPFNMISQTHLSQLPNLGKLPAGPSALHQGLNPSRPFPTVSSPRSDQHHRTSVGLATKNPKKRTRASRRAPTTVLTTDTSNFRAMVQEFTGIPAPPFSTGSPFSSSRRLDIFRLGHHHLESLYNPFRGPAQKVQTLTPSSLPPSSSSPLMLNHHFTVDSTTIASSTACARMNTDNITPSSNQYHLLPDLAPQRPSLNNILNINQNNQNPVLSFQSSPSQHHYHHPHDLHHQTIPFLDELGHANVNLGGLQQQDHGATDREIVNRDNHDHQLRPFNVSSLEFDRQDVGLEISNNISSSRAQAPATWTCPTE